MIEARSLMRQRTVSSDEKHIGFACLTARHINARCLVFRNLEHLLTQSVITIVRDSEPKRLTVPYCFNTSHARRGLKAELADAQRVECQVTRGVAL